MSAVTTDVEPVRCSTWARAESLDPVGTAGFYDSFLLLEAPLPWPRDVSAIPHLAPLPPVPGRRLQALVPSSLGAPAAERQVILYERDPGAPFSGYTRHSMPQGSDLAAAVTALPAAPVEDGVDVLVCTHGRRDVCCGSLGTDLALQLAARDPRPGVRFWRTSHTGGHRFAATFIVLPQGTAWAYGDPGLVDRVLERSVPFADVAAHYRGCAGLGPPPVQAVERAVLAQVGWDLMDRPRRGAPTGESTAGGGAVVRLEAATDRWEAVVTPGRELPVPDCMRPLAEATKSEHEWVVSDLRPV